MKNTLIIIIFLFSANPVVYSQLIESKLNIYLSAGTNTSYGNQDVTEGNYITPSLFANFEKGNNFSFTGTYQLKPFFSIGLQIKNTNFSNWFYDDKVYLYQNSSSRIKSFGPVIKIHSKIKDEGFFNRFSAALSLVPTINNVNVNLEKSIFDIQPVNPADDLLNSVITSFGAEIHGVIEYSITQHFGVFIDGGFGYNGLDGTLYSDKRLISSNLNLGFSIKLMKNKHYYY